MSSSRTSVPVVAFQEQLHPDAQDDRIVGDAQDVDASFHDLVRDVRSVRRRFPQRVHAGIRDETIVLRFI